MTRFKKGFDAKGDIVMCTSSGPADLVGRYGEVVAAYKLKVVESTDYMPDPDVEFFYMVQFAEQLKGILLADHQVTAA